MRHEVDITKDLPGKTIVVTRAFDAPVGKVWRAFSERDILDKWWAPKPCWIETKTMDFRPGGLWHFCMHASKDERFWWRVNYEAIEPQRSIASSSGRAGEDASFHPDVVPMRRLTEFAATPTGAVVMITIKFEKEEDLKMMVEGGMISGTTKAFDNLDVVLEDSLISQS